MILPAYKFKYPDGLDLEDKVAYGIGGLVMEWGACESVFSGLLEALAGRGETNVGSILWLSTRNNRDRIELIVRLSKVQAIAPVTAAEVADACKRFRGVTKVRNFYCHSYFHADTSGTVLGVHGYQLTDEDDPLQIEYRPLTKGLLNEITCAINDAKQLGVDAWRLLIRLRDALKVTQPALPPGLHEYLSRVEPQPRP